MGLKHQNNTSSNAGQKPIFVVKENDAGQRLDNFLLKHCKNANKSSCYKLIRKGQIRINGKRVKPLQKIAAGDQVRVPPFLFFVEPTKVVVPENLQQQLLKEIIFEDADYLVLNKPPGLPCHAGTGHPFGVIEIIHAEQGFAEVQLAHRLDKDTSGCLLLAKNRVALLAFQDALKLQQVEKTYLAILIGQLTEPLVVNEPLDTEHRINGIRHVIVSQTGSPAQTQFQPLNHQSECSLVQCDIASGRTHQIRVHAKHIGHPVLGDRFYGTQAPELTRALYLHAQKLQFKAYSFVAPVPVDFEQVVTTR